MPQPLEEQGAPAEGQPAEGVDAFGQSSAEAKPPENAPEAAVQKKEFADIPEDHPALVKIREQFDTEKETIKKEYGSNLSGQRSKIRTLEKRLDEIEKGTAKGEAPPEVLFKPQEIKWSKDLTKEERDNMTDTEIRQMDQIAGMMTHQNKLYAEQQARDKSQAEKEKEAGEAQVEDLNKTVRNEAMELAKAAKGGKEDTELANQIIESFKGMKFNTEGLSIDEVKQRVAIAASQLSDYKPPKEQPTTHGKPVKDNAASADPFNSDKIIEEATKGTDGSYEL